MTTVTGQRLGGSSGRMTTAWDGDYYQARDAHAGADSTQFLPRRTAGRRRVAGVALVAAGCAVTWAAVIAGGQLSRGAVVPVLFAAAMIVCALGQTLLGPAAPVLTGDRVRPGPAGRGKRLGTCAVVVGCLAGPAVGGAALGAGLGTSLLTALAVACAIAGIATQRRR